jgi:alpha-L-fucosidase
MNGTPEHFNEKDRKDLTAADVRFTTKNDVLYAFVMGQNAGETRIAALSASQGFEQRPVAGVELLGSREPLRWRLTENGLIIGAPQQWPSEHAVAYKIRFA